MLESRLCGLVMRGALAFDEPAQTLLLIAEQPFADPGSRGLKQTSGGLGAVLPRALEQTQAMLLSISHFPDQDVQGGGL